MNEKLFVFIHCLKFLQIIHDMTASTHQQLAASTRKKISWAPVLAYRRAVNLLKL